MKNLKLAAPALVTAAGIACSALATNTNETEANETKALANPVVGMTSGDTITGTTTGTSTTAAGLASADTFRIKTAPAALGIYRHQLVLTTTGTVGHSGSIRGMGQTAAAAASWNGSSVGTPSGADNVAQVSATTTTPGRANVWFGFGKEEEVYYRVTGSASTTSPYVATLTDSVVTPVTGPSNITEGPVTISTIGQTTLDTDFWLYDSGYNAILGAGCDDESVNGGGTGLNSQGLLTRILAPGVYTLAIGRYNLANNQGSPCDDDFRAATMLDFPNAILDSATANTTSDLDVSIGGSVVTVLGPAATGLDVQFVRFTVVSSSSSTPPSGVAAVTPSSIYTAGMAPVLPGAPTSGTVTVTVTPGSNPPSTDITVSVNASAAGLGAINALDNGVAPDAVAGDHVFTAVLNASGATPGAYSFPVTVSDAQARSAGTTLQVNLLHGIVNLGAIDTSTDGALVVGADLIGARPRWFTFTSTAPADAQAGTWFDIDTSASPDTELGLFATDGTLAGEDDDDGAGVSSLLTFGAGSGVDIDGADTAAVSDGRDGTLPAAAWYLSVSRFNVTHSAGFGVTDSSNPGSYTFTLNFDTNTAGGAVCDSIDFNNDGLFPDTLDIDDFLNVFSGGVCTNDPSCGDIDFNNDGLFPDTLDIDALLSVFSGGPCI